jgi:uncharacterized tellurite resistance protein B-like protein
MSLLKKLFGVEPENRDAGGGSDTDTMRRITSALEEMEPERARFIAAFAATLSRVANADLDISEAETRAMEKIIMERGHLPEELAILVVQIAKSQSRLFGGTEDYVVTREFARISTRDQRLALLDCLFAISAADDEVSTAEDNAIRIIAEEFKLDHSEFIAARSAYRDYLAVLKNGARGAGKD